MIPYLLRNEHGYEVRALADGLALGFVEHGPNMTQSTGSWGWTIGYGWHTGLPTLGAALDALMADPMYGAAA